MALSACLFWWKRPHSVAAAQEIKSEPASSLSGTTSSDTLASDKRHSRTLSQASSLPDKHVQPLNMASALRVPFRYTAGLIIRGSVGIGSCGRTYAAVWHGSHQVAVKIMEHDVRPDNTTKLGTVPALKIAVQHKNVLPIYRFVVIELPKPIPQNLLPERERSSGHKQSADRLVDLIDDGSESDLDEEAYHGTSVALPQLPPSPTEDSGVMRKGQIVYEWDVMRHPALGSDFALPMTPAPSLAEPMEIQAHPIPLEDQPHRQLQVEGAPEAAQDPPLFDTARLSDPLPFGMYEIWVIMEFADKGSLEDHIAKKRLVRLADGSPDREAILRILLDVSRGMAAVHAAGLEHLDLKPGNIMLVTNPLDPRGFTAKVADAGLLPLLNLLQTHASTRQRRYMRVQPPEVVQSGLKIPAGDVYSFAMVMWQLWTGEQAYKGMDMHVFHREIVEDGKRPDPPEDMPSKYAALMQACWAADPTSRPSFESIAAEVEAQLSELVASLRQRNTSQ